MKFRQIADVARHNRALDAHSCTRRCHRSELDAEAASGSGSRLDVFCATVRHDARRGQYYGAQASRAPQAAFGIGLPSMLSEGARAMLEKDDDSMKRVVAEALRQPSAGALNHLVAGATLATSWVAGAVSGVVTGLLAGAALGAVGLVRDWRTAHHSARCGAHFGLGVGLSVLALSAWVSTVFVNRGVAYGLGSVTLAVRAAGHVVGGVLFGAAGVVHGAVAAARHAPRIQADSPPPPRASGPDFAFA